jgi:hypothetical protein
VLPLSIYGIMSFFELWDNETLYQLSITFLICGHPSISFLTNSIAKQKLETIIKTSNISHVVNLPTRISNNKGMLIYRIFLDSTKYYCISVYPKENGLSDHHAQLLILENIKIPFQKPAHKNKIWISDNQTIGKFQLLLKEETWYMV